MPEYKRKSKDVNFIPEGKTMQAKSIKSAAKEAKMRLKSRFWQDYKRDLDSSVKIAKEEGIGESGVKTYFKNRVVKNVRGTSAEEEAFYVKVKEMLDRCGCRPSAALDMLMDKREFLSLSYEERERYLFRLSERYLVACKRYDEEKGIEKCLIGR